MNNSFYRIRRFWERGRNGTEKTAKIAVLTSFFLLVLGLAFVVLLAVGGRLLGIVEIDSLGQRIAARWRRKDGH